MCRSGLLYTDILQRQFIQFMTNNDSEKLFSHLSERKKIAEDQVLVLWQKKLPGVSTANSSMLELASLHFHQPPIFHLKHLRSIVNWSFIIWEWQKFVVKVKNCSRLIFVFPQIFETLCKLFLLRFCNLASVED